MRVLDPVQIPTLPSRGGNRNEKRPGVERNPHPGEGVPYGVVVLSVKVSVFEYDPVRRASVVPMS
jgi:hypothetical protein